MTKPLRTVFAINFANMQITDSIFHSIRLSGETFGLSSQYAVSAVTAVRSFWQPHAPLQMLVKPYWSWVLVYVYGIYLSDFELGGTRYQTIKLWAKGIVLRYLTKATCLVVTLIFSMLSHFLICGLQRRISEFASTSVAYDVRVYTVYITQEYIPYKV